MKRKEVEDLIKLSIRHPKKCLKMIWDSNLLKFVLIIFIIFLLLIDFYNLSLFRGTPDYERFGTVGDWFSNFATLIAVVIAAVTIINDKRIAESDRKYNQNVREIEQQRRETERIKQQELLSMAVYVWISGEQDRITGEIVNFKLFLSNKTGAPVFDWNIYTKDCKILASSKNYGPIFPELIKEISVKQLESNTFVAIRFKSFNGKCWSRSGADIKEETYV